MIVRSAPTDARWTPTDVSDELSGPSRGQLGLNPYSDSNRLFCR